MGLKQSGKHQSKHGQDQGSPQGKLTPPGLRNATHSRLVDLSPLRGALEGFYEAASGSTSWDEDTGLRRSAIMARYEFSVVDGDSAGAEFWLAKLDREVGGDPGTAAARWSLDLGRFGVNPENLDELVHEFAIASSEECSAINNQGMAAQVKALVVALGPTETVKTLKEALSEPFPAIRAWTPEKVGG